VAVDGLTLYPAQPSLDEKTVGRADTMTSTRVDSATYMLEKPGDHLLPAIDVRWWDLASGKVETIHLDAIALHVAAGLGSQANAPRASAWAEVVGLVLDHWRLAVLAAIALAVTAWFLPRGVRTIAAGWRRRHRQYLQSEAWSFRQWRRTARSGDAKATYFALLGWLQRFEPLAPDHSLETLKAAAQDATLDREIGTIERQLFAPGRGSSTSWSGTKLLRRVSAVRKTLQRRPARDETAYSLPRRLNPISGRAVPDRRHRLPAR
jgi:hypothetical protein